MKQWQKMITLYRHKTDRTQPCVQYEVDGTWASGVGHEAVVCWKRSKLACWAGTLKRRCFLWLRRFWSGSSSASASVMRS